MLLPEISPIPTNTQLKKKKKVRSLEVEIWSERVLQKTWEEEEHFFEKLKPKLSFTPADSLLGCLEWNQSRLPSCTGARPGWWPGVGLASLLQILSNCILQLWAVLRKGETYNTVLIQITVKILCILSSTSPVSWGCMSTSLTSQVYSDHLVFPACPVLCLRIHVTMKPVPGRIIFSILNSRWIPFDRNSKYISCILIGDFFLNTTISKLQFA